MPLLVPGVPRQVAIADFLDRECARIATLEAELDDYAGHLHDPTLEKFRHLTEGMPRGRIGYGFEVQLGKMLDEKQIDPENVSPYLRNTNVQWGRIELHDLKRMTFTPTDRRKFELQRGDLLVCEGGEPGRAAVWNGELEDCYFQKALHRVRPHSDASVRFLLWCLRDLSQSGAFLGDGPGRYTHLTADQLRAVRIPMPSPEVQRCVAARVDANAAVGCATELEISGLAELLINYREALITEAVTGRIDVSRISEQRANEAAIATIEGGKPEVLLA